jgi:hypothetical protein
LSIPPRSTGISDEEYVLELARALLAIGGGGVQVRETIRARARASRPPLRMQLDELLADAV